MSKKLQKNQELIPGKSQQMSIIAERSSKDNSCILNSHFTGSLIMLFILFMIGQGCKKDAATSAITGDQNTDALRHGHDMDFEPVNLVSDTTSYGAARIDSNVNNVWGIAFSPSGALWIASNHRGLSLILDGNGNQLRTPVNIPLGADPNGSSPDGAVFNNTSDFVIPSKGEKSKFIFATEDGIISAWSSGNSAITVADRSSSGAVYKGIAIAKDGGSNFIYATNFFANKVDVFDASFNYVTSKPFNDPGIPSDFAPFNIANIDGKLFVTYARQKPDHLDDQSGPHNGFIDIYKPDGSFVKRFASHGTLNSPWGITASPGDRDDHGERHGEGHRNNILVGNFGDGRINIFDADGNFRGQLKDDGKAIVIEGLWAIAFPPDNISNGRNRLYFTAGPDDEDHGLFGYLSRR